jgi:hypothetical protein
VTSRPWWSKRRTSTVEVVAHLRTNLRYSTPARSALGARVIGRIWFKKRARHGIRLRTASKHSRHWGAFLQEKKKRGCTETADCLDRHAIIKVLRQSASCPDVVSACLYNTSDASGNLREMMFASGQGRASEQSTQSSSGSSTPGFPRLGAGVQSQRRACAAPVSERWRLVLACVGVRGVRHHGGLAGRLVFQMKTGSHHAARLLQGGVLCSTSMALM